MEFSNNKIEEFFTNVNNLGIWSAYEIKACLLRNETLTEWKIRAIHILLLDSGDASINILYSHECLKLIREVRPISTLETLLGEIADKTPLTIGKQRASLELISETPTLDFKNKQYMLTTYLIDNACYLLEKGSNNNPEFNKIESTLRLRLPHHIMPKEGLYEACKSVLNIKVGGGYYPHIQAYAPIFLKLKNIKINKRRILVSLYCHKLLEKDKVKVNLHGKDENDEGTFDAQILRFKKLGKKTNDVVSSSTTFEPYNITRHLKVNLYSENIQQPLEVYVRPFKLEVLPKLSSKEIQKRKLNIKKKYNRAKKERNHNIKGRLLEEIVSELLSLVQGLKIVGKNINSGIEEIDLQVVTESVFGIWREFDTMLFVECKNWSTKVGSDEIRNFEGKLRNFWLHTGIFVAIKGFTGDGRKDGAVGQNKLRFKQERIKIIFLDGNDLNDILNGQDISEKITDKWINLFQ